MTKQKSHIDELRSADREKLGVVFETQFSEVFKSTNPTSNFVLITSDRKIKELSNKLFKTNYEC